MKDMDMVSIIGVFLVMPARFQLSLASKTLQLRVFFTSLHLLLFYCQIFIYDRPHEMWFYEYSPHIESNKSCKQIG
jgi:hypothetical protein